MKDLLKNIRSKKGFAFKKLVLFCGLLIFLALCVFFINKFVISTDAGAQSRVEKVKKAITKKGEHYPLVLSDFNSGSLYTNIGSLSGGDEEDPGKTFAVVVGEENVTKGRSGYSVMLDYDVDMPGEYSFYWMKLGKKQSEQGDATDTLDLSDYDYLSFWIKGQKGAESAKVELHEDRDGNNVFTFGTDVSSYVYTAAYIPSGKVTTEWQKIVIPLDSFKAIRDWSNVLELVIVFENMKGPGKSALYVDDFIFGKRPESVLAAAEVQELQAPDAATFKVNGLPAAECPIFERSNDFMINAESFNENPFIESVSFECSTDGGKTWKRLGTDYNVDTAGYMVSWQPRESVESENCQIRAVATDIYGNEKATGVLIDCGIKPLTDEEFLELIERKGFDFFIEHQNMRTGLFADTSGGGSASIASTGFGLTALCVGAERGWISKADAGRRALICLNSFLPKEPGGKPLVQGKYGFFYHFVDMNTGKRSGKSEISTVDTALLVCGALTAGEYFGGEIKEKATEIYKAVEWGEFLSQEEGPWGNVFSMGWSPERGFLEAYWDFYTDEVVLVSLLAVGSPTHPVDPEAFYKWTRYIGPYEDGEDFVYSWHGALFSYQYAHVWFDFRDIVDRDGINWFDNSRKATLANRQFCIDHRDEYKTYGPNTWGVTSMDRPEAYTMHYGTPPTGSGEALHDGTISPTGPAGSMPFTPYLSLSALKYMYLHYPRLWGEYGIKDSYNLETNWYASTYYGIGVAMMVLPIENFRSGFIWKTFMKNEYIQDALKKTGFTKMEKQ